MLPSVPFFFYVIFFFQFYWDIIDIQHCISLRSTEWFDLHTSWNGYHSRFSEHLSYHIDAKWKKRKIVFFLIRTVEIYCLQFSSVQSLSRVRLFATPPTPGAHSVLHPSSRRCHAAVSSSVVTFSSCPQSLPASESFLVSQPFTWGGQSTRVSALASFLPKNTRGWSPLGWTGWISLQSKGLSRVFSNTTVQKHQFFSISFLHRPTLTSIDDHWKNHNLD